MSEVPAVRLIFFVLLSLKISVRNYGSSVTRKVIALRVGRCLRCLSTWSDRCSCRYLCCGNSSRGCRLEAQGDRQRSACGKGIWICRRVNDAEGRTGARNAADLIVRGTIVCQGHRFLHIETDGGRRKISVDGFTVNPTALP